MLSPLVGVVPVDESRAELPSGEGILLRPASSIHTFFMRFPIDVVFLDRSLVVRKVVHRMRPWRMAFGSARTLYSSFRRERRNGTASLAATA